MTAASDRSRAILDNASGFTDSHSRTASPVESHHPLPAYQQDSRVIPGAASHVDDRAPDACILHAAEAAYSDALTSPARVDIFLIYFCWERAMPNDAMLVRFRDSDSKEGISRATMKKIARALDLSETAAVHRALVELAQRYVPQYPRDNGPISERQRRAIREIVRKRHGGASVVESLFEGFSQASSQVKPRGRKRVSASRAR
jgi:hypothetical protein